MVHRNRRNLALTLSEEERATLVGLATAWRSTLSAAVAHAVRICFELLDERRRVRVLAAVARGEFADPFHRRPLSETPAPGTTSRLLPPAPVKAGSRKAPAKSAPATKRKPASSRKGGRK